MTVTIRNEIGESEDHYPDSCYAHTESPIVAIANSGGGLVGAYNLLNLISLTIERDTDDETDDKK